MTHFTLTILFFLSLFATPTSEIREAITVPEPITVMESDLIITEIMYHPDSPDSKWEWIEIHNKGEQTINLAGYVLDDNNNTKQNSANIFEGSIAPGGIAVLFDDDITIEEFTAVWGELNAIPVDGWPGLNNPGDSIGIWDSFAAYDGDNISQSNVIEQVIYEDTNGWVDSNATSSIYLTDVNKDNTLGANWVLNEIGISDAFQSKELHGNGGGDIGSPGIITTIVDDTPPTIECPEMVEIDHDEGRCSVVVPLLLPSVLDAISTEINFNSVRSDGLDIEDPFPVGDTVITWTATDGADNTSLPCDQLVRVVELELPTAIAQNITVELDENGVAIILPKDLDNVETPSFDNCGIAEYMASRTEFDCSDLDAPVLVQFSVLDPNGNTSIVTNVEVTVVDILKPVITCNVDIVTISSNGNPIILEEEFEPLVTDNCDVSPVVSYTRSDEQELNAPFEVGTTTIMWQAVDASDNIEVCTQTIVVDFIPSIGKDIIAFSIPEQVGETTIDVGAKTIDLLMPIGTDVTELTPVFEVSEHATSIPEIGESVDFTEPVVYIVKAQDDSDEEWLVTVIVEEDTTPPTFEVKGNTEDFVTELEVGDTYLVGDISNIVDESITVSEILGDDQVDTTQEGGPFLVSYSVSDGLNKTTITETINVVDSNQVLFEITSFTLVNADTNEDLFLLEEGMVININSLSTLNLDLRANATDNTMSVNLALSGDKSTSRTENVFPYALYGDSPAGNYKGSEFGIGRYTVSATPYAESQSEGDSGEELRLNFQIIEPQRPFITTWKTDNPGVSGDNQITIPTFPGETYNYTVDWGDGSSNTNVAGEIMHAYETSGTYQISITGDFPKIDFGIEGDKDKLIEINQWGEITWLSMLGSFVDCTNMNVVASDTPNLSQVSSITNMFVGCSSLVGNESFNLWDVSNVTEMGTVFSGAARFTANIESWDTGNVVFMSGMFDGATDFNSNISDWDVSNVTEMTGMFNGASSFNQDLEEWDVSKVADMKYMLLGSGLSNGNYDKLLNAWSAQQLQSRVTFDAGNSQYCLGEAARQKLIDNFGWTITDGGKAEDCVAVEAPADLIAATYLQGAANPSPTGPILRTEDGNRETYLKFDLSTFSGPITQATLQMQVASDPGNGTLEVFLGSNSTWTETGLNGTNKPSIVGEALASISGTHSLGQTKTWNLDFSQIASGSELTLIVKHSNGNDVAFESDETSRPPQLLITSGSVVQLPFITTWKTDNEGVSGDNQITIPTFPSEIYNYTVDWGDGLSDTNVTGDISHTYANPGMYTVSISGLFPRILFGVFGISNAPNLDTDRRKIISIDQWGSNVWESMASAFSGCINLDVSATDVPDLSKVRSTQFMFDSCFSLVGNPTFNEWDTSTLVDMSFMFAGTSMFNQPIGQWDTSSVTIMEEVFAFSLFNSDIGNWNTSQVSNMREMFEFSFFNQNISGWNVSKVRDMHEMFQGSAFNQGISQWNVSKVEDMFGMFSGAKDFNQDLSLWRIESVNQMGGIFTGSDLSNENYDNILIAWSTLEELQDGVEFGAQTNQYCQGEAARQKLIDDFGWTINDGGKVLNCNPLVEGEADLIDATYLQGSKNPQPMGPILRAEEGNRVSYLKFDMGALSGSIVQAQLKMQIASDPGNGTLEIFLGSDSNWTETDLNGGNKPTEVGSALAMISGAHKLGQTKTWNLNVGQLPSSGMVTLIVKHSNGNDVAFASDETNQAPQLIITTEGPGVSGKSANTLSLSPNPAVVETTLSLKEPAKLVMIYIYDVLGRMVGSYEGNEIEDNGAYVLDVQSIPAGTYYIKSYDGDGSAYQKQMLIKK